MPEASREPTAFLPLKPDVFLLSSVLAEEDRHGYGMMPRRREAAGRPRAHPGTEMG